MATAAVYDVLFIAKGTLGPAMITAIDTAVAAHHDTAFVRSVVLDPYKGQFVVIIEKPPIP